MVFLETETVFNFGVGGIAIGATTLPSQQKSFVRLALFEIAKSADEQQTKKC